MARRRLFEMATRWVYRETAIKTAPLLAAYGPPFGFCEGGADASREDSDAPCARSASFEDRRDFRQRDRPAAESGAVDCPIDATAADNGGARLAAAGGTDRRRTGGAAVQRRWHQARASPSSRARLGRGSPRAEAQARDAADPVGRVHRAASRRLSLFPLLRAVPRLGITTVGDDAADPCRRRQAVCRLRRRYGAGDHRSAQWQDPAGADFFRRARRLELHLCRSELDAGLGDWIAAHTRAFAAIGGVPRLLVPDNSKVAVIKACLYEPQVNRSYAEMAAHYDTAILPARPRRPRDKAKVEAAVLIIERWLLGRLRHRRFYSLAELN